MWLTEKEGAKFWPSELKNRGLQDILIACVHGQKDFPDAINSVYPQMHILLCFVHMLRNSLKYVLWKDYRAVTSGLKASVSGTNRRVSANGAGCVLRNVGRQVSANQQKLACARGKSQYILRLSIRYPQSHLSAPAALPLRRPHLHPSEISLHGSPDIPTKIIRYSQCPGRRPLNRLSDTKSILQHCSTYAKAGHC